MAILSEQFRATALQTAPAQIWRHLRLVPILTNQVRQDLRLSRRVIQACLTEVEIDDNLRYTAYVPHAYVMQWRNDGSSVVAQGTQIKEQGHEHWKETWIQPLHRMSKRERKQQLRFLPLHLAMELYLAEHFHGPDIDWRADYNRKTISQGLNPRMAAVISGADIYGLAEALRVFEIYPQQVGMMLFVNDHLATVAIYPHPDDYKALHQALLGDMFCEIFWYASYPHVPAYHLEAGHNEPVATSWDMLRNQLQARHGALDDFQRWMAGGVLDEPVKLERIYQAGPFTLQRFRAELHPSRTLEAHMGELIHTPEGHLRYLKTYRLSKEQLSQAWYLEQLAENHWHLERTAQKLHMSKDQLVLKMQHIGLGRMLQPKLVDQAHKRLR